MRRYASIREDNFQDGKSGCESGGVMMSLAEEGKRRGCYCGVWETSPQTYETLGYPRGFCGICERCGQPGHTRHFPGAVPYTGSWCDYHYWMLFWTDLRSPFGFIIWLLVLGSLAFLI